MFTGLVEELGKVTNITRTSQSVRITIGADKVLTDVKIGDSIAVNGTCLTAVDYNTKSFTADVMPETVNRTVLASLKPGDIVNLERCLKVGDRLGGHIVSGHIDGIGTITAKQRNDIAIIVTITASPHLLRYIIPKGSIAVDGTSLTVVEIGANWFTVSLIPHTAGLTTVGLKSSGQPVNLEVDIIGKYVERLLGQPVCQNKSSSKMTTQFLQENGFL